MSYSIKTEIPGAIIVRQYKTGEYLYFRGYKQRKWKSTGLKYSKSNVKTVEKILESEYKKYLSNNHQISYKESRVTINRVFNEYKEVLKKTRSSSTLKEYSNSFTQIVSGDYDITTKASFKNRQAYLIELDIVNFIENNCDKLKNVTINKHLRHLQVFINYMSDEYSQGYLNYYKKYKLTEEEKEVVPYTKEEALQIIAKAKEKDEILYSLLMLFYLTGGRLNEWLNAYFDKDPFNIDMKNRIIKFRNKIKRNSFQTIPMTDEVYSILSRLKELEEKRVRYKGKVIPYSPKSKSSITRQINKIETELEIKKKGRSTHGFRRLLATELFKKEIPFDVIKDIMRHSTIETTIKAYRKIDQSRVADALKKLDR